MLPPENACYEFAFSIDELQNMSPLIMARPREAREKRDAKDKLAMGWKESRRSEKSAFATTKGGFGFNEFQ